MDRQKENNWDHHIYELASAYESGMLNVLLDPATYQQLIDYYQTEEQFEKALAVARLAASHYRFTVDFNTRQVQILLKINRYSEALELIDKALLLSPADKELLLLKAESYISQGAFMKGMTILAELKSGAQGAFLSEIQLVEALAFERRSDFEAMFDALKGALEANPENASALERISLCMAVCRKYDEGIALYKWLLDQNPYDALVWYFLAHAYVYLGQNAAAIEAYEYAFLAAPDFEEAHHEFVGLCIEEKCFSEALKVLQEISEKFDVDGDVLTQIGTCYNGLDKYETARKYLKKASHVDVHNEEIYFQLGKSYAGEQNWSQAYAYLRKAIRLSPDCESYQRDFALVAFHLKKYTEAENSYQKALALDQDDQQNWLNLAWFLMEMNRSEEALELLNEAKLSGVEANELNYSYCACLFANGKRQEGLYYLSILLDNDYKGYPWLFEWQPLLNTDKEINALLSLYRP